MRIALKIKIQQEAFRERRHLHVCDIWPCGVTLTFRQGQESDVIRCRFLYCTLATGKMSMSTILFEILSQFVYFI